MHGAGAVGVLSPFVGGTYYGNLVRSVGAAAESYDRRMIAIQTLDAAADIVFNGGNPAFDAPVSWDHVGGFVVFADAASEDYLARLERAGKPVVLVGHTVAGFPRPTVLADNGAGVREAVTHLIRAHGCRRIAFSGYLPATDVQERYEAYREVLAAHGLEPGPFLPAANNIESGIDWTVDDLTRDGLPDALVTATDRNALGAQRMLAAAGLNCPDDYLLTGFDNLDLATFVRPELATVAQPLDAMSRFAVDLLVRQLNGEDVAPEVHRLPARFMARTSCGCTGYASALPDLELTDPLWRLEHRLAGVLPLGNGGAEIATTAAATTVRALTAAAGGDTSGLLPALTELNALLMVVPSQETLRVICRSVQEYANGLTHDDPEAPGRIGRAVQDMIMFLGRAHSRNYFGDQLHLRSLISVNYSLSMALLHRRDADPKDPAWLAMTPATAGSIALRGPRGDLTRTPGWRRFPGPPIPGGPTRVESFPPAEVLDAAGPGDTVFVVRAKVGDSDRGWLALVDRVEHLVDDGRELVNQCAALLTVALDLRDQEAQLLRAAHSDRLTGLPNRTSFTAALEAAIGRGRFTVLFLDLDGFKRINDTLGHHAGDQLLVRVADRIRDSLRAGDVAARFGGDEFLVLLDGVAPGPELNVLVERLETAVSAPYRLDDEFARVGVSIGWADGAAGSTVEQLLQEADRSMYRKKAASRNPRVHSV
ncbi:GGDEF domain-containing protein [Actinoplanes sp. NPDC051861]|uniref:GGDEF domain-containing protein n=1 Tax=Actinoplanes sp. NPDC051861 TaxID=3155170 RepID=UPI003439FB0E